MPVGRRAAVGIALLVAGLLLVGVGAASYVDAQRCRLTQSVAVTPAPNATGPATPHAELAEPARRVFVGALEARTPVMTKRGAIDPELVRYENATYRVSVHRRSDCDPFHPLYVETPVGLGAVMFLAGAAIARGRRRG